MSANQAGYIPLGRDTGRVEGSGRASRESIPEPNGPSGIELTIMELEGSLADLYKTIDALEGKLAPVRISLPYNIKDYCSPEKVASKLNNRISESCLAIRRIEERIQTIIREVDL